jgi:sugar O-acyltransferase (sialic acid O-acetyltransferase NeuD family)
VRHARRLAILGAGGHGAVVADAALRAGWEEVVFFDDRWPETSEHGPWAVAGRAADLTRYHADFGGAVVAVGDNARRLEMVRELAAAGATIATVVDPGAVVSRFATLGPGTVVLPAAAVNAFAVLGVGCIVNTGASVDHHCVLGDGVHVSPGAHLGGRVSVGEGAWIGLGAAVRNGVAVGAGAIVGVGAAVVGDIPERCTVVGVPAKPFRPGQAR